jgi:hypothetical protein
VSAGENQFDSNNNNNLECNAMQLYFICTTMTMSIGTKKPREKLSCLLPDVNNAIYYRFAEQKFPYNYNLFVGIGSRLCNKMISLRWRIVGNIEKRVIHANSFALGVSISNTYRLMRM